MQQKNIWLLALVLTLVGATAYAAYPSSYWQAEQNGEVYELNYGDGTTNISVLKVFDSNKIGANQFCDKYGNNCSSAAAIATAVAGGGSGGGKFVDGTNAADAVFTGGNVGIGTTSPVESVHIGGAKTGTLFGDVSAEYTGELYSGTALDAAGNPIEACQINGDINLHGGFMACQRSIGASLYLTHPADDTDLIDKSFLKFLTGGLLTGMVNTNGIDIELKTASSTWKDGTSLLENGYYNLFADKPLEYMKDATGFVHLRGCLLNATVGGLVNQNVLTMPEGYRVDRDSWVGGATYNNGGGAGIRMPVKMTGGIQIGSSSFYDNVSAFGNICLDGLSYYSGL